MNAAGGDVGGVTAAHRPRVHEAVRHQDEVLRSTLWTFVPPYNVPLHHEDVQLHVSLFLKSSPHSWKICRTFRNNQISQRLPVPGMTTNSAHLLWRNVTASLMSLVL